MQLNRRLATRAVVAAMLYACLFIVAVHAASEPTVLSKGDRDRIRANYRGALTSLMSTESPSDDLFWRANGYEWYLVVRIVASDHTTPEFHFAFWRNTDHTLHARVTRAVGKSIYDQVQQIYMRNPAATRREILEDLSVSTVELAESSSLRSIAAEIERAQLRAIPSNDMIMDPVTYEFRSVARSRTVFFSVIDAPGHGSDASPVVRWADRVRRLLSK